MPNISIEMTGIFIEERNKKKESALHILCTFDTIIVHEAQETTKSIKQSFMRTGQALPEGHDN